MGQESGRGERGVGRLVLRGRRLALCRASGRSVVQPLHSLLDELPVVDLPLCLARLAEGFLDVAGRGVYERQQRAGVTGRGLVVFERHCFTSTSG